MASAEVTMTRIANLAAAQRLDPECGLAESDEEARIDD
jgi:hypothetical protein